MTDMRTHDGLNEMSISAAEAGASVFDAVTATFWKGPNFRRQARPPNTDRTPLKSRREKRRQRLIFLSSSVPGLRDFDGWHCIAFLVVQAYSPIC